MARKRSRQQAAIAIAVPGIMVSDTQKFVKECGSTLARLLRQRHLGFFKASESHGKAQYSLSGTQVTPIASDRRYAAVPFYATDFIMCWLAATLNVESKERRDFLTSISITIFSGNFTEDKIPLLRAEWDCSSNSRDTPHAQPHWHVYSSRFREIVGRQIVVDSTPEVKDFVPVKSNVGTEKNDSSITWEEGEKFHYAMSALWARHGRGAHKEEVIGASGVKWLDGCISYILDQFQYLYPRLHT